MTKEMCSYCIQEPAIKPPKNREKLGEIESNAVEVGHGHAWEKVQRWRCLNCGTIWAEVEEGGAGGHDYYYQRRAWEA